MKIRQGGLDDVPTLMRMYDGAVAWLVARGLSEQYGSEPFTERPRMWERTRQKVHDGTLWVAEVDAVPAGAMAVGPPAPYVPPADEPALHLTLLLTDRAFTGRGVGSALVRLAREEAGRAGVGLLRVDCYGGGGGGLVRYYERNGFEREQSFTIDGHWPGQVLRMRI